MKMIDVRIEWKEELGNLTAPIIQDALRHFVQTRNITVREIPAQPEQKYRADFLWPHENNSAEEAGFEFANGTTESYTQQWWDILKKRIRALPQPEQDEMNCCRTRNPLCLRHLNCNAKPDSAQPEQGKGVCAGCYLNDKPDKCDPALRSRIKDECASWQPFPAKADDKNLCVWKWETNGFYYTGCGSCFSLNTGTLKENEMYFCHKCGKKIKENCHAHGEERYEK